jgi:phosphoserine phosphatase RsbX
MSYGIALRGFQGGKYCGDQGSVWEGRERSLVCIVDGLGHGEGAEIAAKAAVKYVDENQDMPIDELFLGCDKAISHTRGVAMALALIDLTSRDLWYAAVGNTRAAISGMDELYLGCNSGIVGEGISRPTPELYEFTRKQSLYLWSDGMADALNFRKYRNARHPDLESLARQILDENGTIDEDDGSLIIFRKS